MKRHIVCLGDSNTHGYCARTNGRFDENERWTCLLEKNWEKTTWSSRRGFLGEPPAFPIPSTKPCPAWIIFIPA